MSVYVVPTFPWYLFEALHFGMKVLVKFSMDKTRVVYISSFKAQNTYSTSSLLKMIQVDLDGHPPLPLT